MPPGRALNPAIGMTAASRQETKYYSSGRPSSWRSYNHSLKLLGNDEAEAFRLNLLAAQNGMRDAVLAMGWLYLNGVGIERDEDAANGVLGS
jgi:TPR repeat protein